MKLSVIEACTTNLLEIVLDDSVYVITRGGFLCTEEFKIRPAKGVSVETILSEETIVVRISE